MDSAIVLENTLRKAQDILWEALSPGTSRGATRADTRVGGKGYLFVWDASAWPDKIISTLWAFSTIHPKGKPLGSASDTNTPCGIRSWKYRITAASFFGIEIASTSPSAVLNSRAKNHDAVLSDHRHCIHHPKRNAVMMAIRVVMMTTFRR